MYGIGFTVLAKIRCLSKFKYGYTKIIIVQMEQIDDLMIRLLANNRKMTPKPQPQSMLAQTVNTTTIKKIISNFENDIMNDDFMMSNIQILPIILQKYLTEAKNNIQQELSTARGGVPPSLH